MSHSLFPGGRYREQRMRYAVCQVTLFVSHRSHLVGERETLSLASPQVEEMLMEGG